VPLRLQLTIAALLAALMFASGCGTTGSASSVTDQVVNDPASDSASSSNGTLFIGSVASLTGSGEPYGISQVDGTSLAVEIEGETSAYPIEFVSLDDSSAADAGISAFGSLIEQGASVIVGPTLSPVAAKADPLAQAVGVPVLAVTNTTLDITAIGDAVWRISLSERAMLPQGVAAARDLRGVTTAVLISDGTDDYSTGAADGFRSAADAAGVTVLDDVTFDPTELDPSRYRSLISGAVASSPDAILLAARSRPAVDLLVAIQQLGLTETIVGSNGFNTPEVLADAGSAANGMIVTASWNPDIDVAASRTFVERFQTRFLRQPDAFAAQSYAGIQVLMAAVSAGGGTSRQAIANGLGELRQVDTVLGTISFVDNEAVYPAAVQVVADGRFELLTRGTP
jgi:branched-chain amino acid transport system substrate-binding protein